MHWQVHSADHPQPHQRWQQRSKKAQPAEIRPQKMAQPARSCSPKMAQPAQSCSLKKAQPAVDWLPLRCRLKPQGSSLLSLLLTWHLSSFSHMPCKERQANSSKILCTGQQ